MTFPSFLYRLTPRDEQVTGVELLQYYSAIISSANVHVDTGASSTGTYVVPKGRVLLIQSYVVEVVPGAAQTLLYCGLKGSSNSANSTPLNAIPLTRRVVSAPAATKSGYGEGIGDIYIPEGGTVSAEAQFNAGAAANSVQLFFSGLLIPRGNFAI